MITLDIAIEGGDWGSLGASLGDVEALAARAAEAAISAAAAPAEGLEAALLLTDDGPVRELNRQWRGIDKATNVLSFPAGSPRRPGQPRHLGDIAVAYGTLMREAQAEDKRPADHLAHLIVHGVLHLLGHDHGDAGEADAMETTEVAALARLGIEDPYRDTVPDISADRPSSALAAG